MCGQDRINLERGEADMHGLGRHVVKYVQKIIKGITNKTMCGVIAREQRRGQLMSWREQHNSESWCDARAEC